MGAQSAKEEEHIYTDAFVGDNSWNGREPNTLLWNRGDGRFVEVAAPLGLDSIRDPRGLAAADFDHDGDVDFVINDYRAPAEAFENRLGQDRSWTAVRLRGTRSNSGGIGALVTVVAGGRRHLRVVTAGNGYASQYSLEQLVGLSGGNQVDAVDVRWPSGLRERFGPFPARKRLLLTEGAGVDLDPPKATLRARWTLSLLVAAAGLLAFLWIRRAGQ